MLEVLRRSPVLHVQGNKTVTLKNPRLPAKTLSLSAEAFVENGADHPVAVVFGPENGAVAEKLVFEAAREAYAKSYAHLYVIGFAIAANARKLVEQCEASVGISATYVQCTPDLMMGDLLKNLRSSQIFSVCGLPEVVLHKAGDKDVKAIGGDPKTKDWYQAELLGLDVFDPGEGDVDHRPGSDVPCWMVDADYNGLCFKATQVFFPRTAAWDDLKRALKGQYDDAVWAHLAGTMSTPFRSGGNGQVAVKVIDDRGNELLVVKDVKEAKG
jgi:adenine-specific DNA-methyltransferase